MPHLELLLAVAAEFRPEVGDPVVEVKPALFDQAEKALTLKGSAGSGISAGAGQSDANKTVAVASGDTADAAPIIVLFVVSVLAAAGAVIIRKRRNM